MSRKSRRNRPQESPTAKLPSSINPTSLGNVPDSREIRTLRQISTQHLVSASFSGPLPPPEILRAYNDIVPGLAAKIVAQVDRQTDHRITMESQVIRSDSRRAWVGLMCGLIVCLFCITSGTICVMWGHDWAGTGIATAAVVGLTGTFIYGTTSRRIERQQKATIMAGKDQPAPATHS